MSSNLNLISVKTITKGDKIKTSHNLVSKLSKTALLLIVAKIRGKDECM